MEGLPPVTKMLNTSLFDTKIRENVDVEEAQARQMPIAEWNDKCAAAVDYAALIDELNEKGVI